MFPQHKLNGVPAAGELCIGQGNMIGPGDLAFLCEERDAVRGTLCFVVGDGLRET